MSRVLLLAHARRALGSRFARLARDTRAVAATEFALVLWLMVLMYLGLTETSFLVGTSRKLVTLSRTLSDLTGRVPNLTTAELDAIFKARAVIMAPYRSDQATMVISSIVVRDTGRKNGTVPILDGTVCWSEARGPGAQVLPPGSKVPVPAGFELADSSFIRADLSLPYAPMFGSAIYREFTGKAVPTLKETTAWPVRNVAEVVRSGTPACLKATPGT